MLAEPVRGQECKVSQADASGSKAPKLVFHHHNRFSTPAPNLDYNAGWWLFVPSDLFNFPFNLLTRHHYLLIAPALLLDNIFRPRISSGFLLDLKAIRHSNNFNKVLSFHVFPAPAETSRSETRATSVFTPASSRTGFLTCFDSDNKHPRVQCSQLMRLRRRQ